MGETSTRIGMGREARPEPELPRPLWSVRRILLVIGLPLLLVVGLVALQLLDRRTVNSETLAGPVDRVVVQVARGDVRLVPAEEGSTDLTVERTERWRFIRPETSVRVDRAGVATVTGSCPRIVIVIGSCAVDYVLRVPPGAQVYVRTDHGTVVAEGLDGWVRIVTDGGAVEASGLRSPEVVVESGGGDADLAFAASPSRIDVRSGGGDVAIAVPSGAFYAVDTRGSTGELDVRVEERTDAERTMRIDSGSGSVVVATN